MPSVIMDRRLPWTWGDVGDPEPLTRGSGGAGRTRLVVRGVQSRASSAALFRWLCQLRRAPYSYDWVDNFGRRSPRTPDPTLLELEVGQSVMTIFSLTAFDPGRSLTLRMKPGWPRVVFGEITVRYEIEEIDETRNRLRAALWLPCTGGRLGGLRRHLLAWGDLIMMRKQLRVLGALAEAEPGEQDRQSAAAGETR